MKIARFDHDFLSLYMHKFLLSDLIMSREFEDAELFVKIHYWRVVQFAQGDLGRPFNEEGPFGVYV